MGERVRIRFLSAGGGRQGRSFLDLVRGRGPAAAPAAAARDGSARRLRAAAHRGHEPPTRWDILKHLKHPEMLGRPETTPDVVWTRLTALKLIPSGGRSPCCLPSLRLA
jgi:hypothetical protein